VSVFVSVGTTTVEIYDLWQGQGHIWKAGSPYLRHVCRSRSQVIVQGHGKKNVVSGWQDLEWGLTNLLIKLLLLLSIYNRREFYFAWKSFDENGNEEVEQNVVAERHEEDEVQSGPRRRPRHASVQHFVPIFLSQNLSTSARAVTVMLTFTDHFSGPGRAIGPVCVCLCVCVCVCLCVCVQIITFELNDPWPRYLACWFNSTVSKLDSKVKSIGHSSRSREENVAKVIGATSSQCLLVW